MTEEPQNDKTGEASGPPTYSAQDVRQGQVILRKRWQRIVFFGGLVGLVLLPLVLMLAAGA
ncbi:hypothetical protein [Phenylobacterium sp.]|uniref:hypothetical protein n=1 Tax=Phenylobacterium sp. TaxID=1871053 RepID=UPI002626EB29|nr:hypothetical protein [Phenylobacterium sp.]